MPLRQIVRIAASLHVALALAGLYYALRIHNFTPVSDLPNTDFLVFSALAAPPAVAAWLGLRLARGAVAERLLAFGQALAATIFAVAFALVLGSDEPLAPLLLVLATLWLAGGFALLLIAVWLAGRYGSKSAREVSS
ncbi:hypothetical protein [Hyphomicrobium sp. DMF-1]|jgi:hypothetical protein|uniref:hypothetical protein n=1 Tax=Hyphomicrobium sp. DMF-1 TaxID=3019544 RepID=UPI0022EBE856|nr:hypothetical protein [Hyphomicrobium sp. DMF-1]WBT40028.1 hypothetical protein PE058_09155 [Hyphomicrobium sp. DMF-1]